MEDTARSLYEAHYEEFFRSAREQYGDDLTKDDVTEALAIEHILGLFDLLPEVSGLSDDEYRLLFLHLEDMVWNAIN